MRNLATGDLIKLGSLYIGGSLKPRPTRPWQTGSTTTGLSGNGDIQGFSAGQSIEIRDTVATDTYKLRWMEVNTMTGKKLLISDRVILTNVSWDDLNAQSLIFGKEVTIDGKRCRLRVMTGSASPIASNMGGATQNEWDMYIGNTSGLPGLLTPTTADNDGRMMASDAASVHNKNWNWYYVYSWCQETHASIATSRVLRGFLGARYWTHTGATQSSRAAYIGWRPVLEILDSAPVISGPEQNLGNKTTPFSVLYSATEPESETFSIIEKLNGTIIGQLSNTTDFANREIVLDISKFASLALNVTHTITVEATDVNGNKTTKEWTFVKTNSAPKIEIVEPTGDLENIAIVDTTTPVLVHRFLDIDGDIQTAYQYVVEDVSAETEVHNTGKVSSTQSFLTVPDGILNWGSRYKFKVKVWDKFDVPSEYSDYEFFMPNRPPTATNLAPGSNSKETPEGTGSEPTFTWAFTDLDLEAQGSYQLKIYKTQDDMLVYNSNRIYKNIQTHTIPQGVLENGYDYYAVLKVWDVNNLSAVTPEAYFRTNATPTTPTQTLPIDNCRTTLRPTFQAIIGTDEENDGMHFAIQVSKDENFSNEVLEYNSKMQRNGWKVNGSDIDTIGATNSSEGQIVSYEMQVDLDRNSTYFWRICGVDANTGAKGAWSSARRVRIGNVLEFELKSPIDTQSVAARRILIAMEYALPQDGNTKAEMKLEVCNNAFDSIPTWENATEKFLKMDYYEFVNYSKTAENYGISIRVTINSNDSMKEIAVYSLGVTFD